MIVIVSSSAALPPTWNTNPVYIHYLECKGCMLIFPFRGIRVVIHTSQQHQVPVTTTAVRFVP